MFSEKHAWYWIIVMSSLRNYVTFGWVENWKKNQIWNSAILLLDFYKKNTLIKKSSGNQL